jgi:hypothetical protein
MIVAIYRAVASIYRPTECFQVVYSFTPLEALEAVDKSGRLVSRCEASAERPTYVRTPDGYKLRRRYGTCDRLMDPTWIIGLSPYEVLRRGVLGLCGFGMADGPEAAEDCVAAPVEAEDDNPF